MRAHALCVALSNLPEFWESMTSKYSPVFRVLSAGALTAGGAYYFLQPQESQSQPARQSNKHESTSQSQQKSGKKDWYEGEHPKPVDDRHGDSVKKHSIAAEKNQYKTRKGVFSKEEFDNHILEHKDPAKDFEKKN